MSKSHHHEGARSSPEADKDICLLVNEIQLLLAEKRTSLSVLRTGIAVFILPMTVVSILIATSKYYDPAKVMPLLITVSAMNVALVILAIYLIVRSLIKLHSLDQLITQLKSRSKTIAELVR